MLRIHGGSVKAKKWKKGVYCLHGDCKSNTKEPIPDVFMVPFKRPCDDWYKSIVDPVAFPHDPKHCGKCSQALRWIHLCKRVGKEMTVFDIKQSSYVCSKHFYYVSGPTDEYPDPFSADMSEDAINQVRSAMAKRLSPAFVEANPIKHDKPMSVLEAALTSAQRPSDPLSNDFDAELDALAVVKVEHFEPDHGIALETVAAILSKHGFAVKHDGDSIRVAVSEGFDVEVKPALDVDIVVMATTVRDGHPVWKKVPKRLDGDGDSIVKCFRSLAQWRVCDVFARSRLAARFQREFVENISESDEVRKVHGLAESCRVLSRNAMCDRCKEPMMAFRRKLAKKAKRKAQKPYSMTHVKYMTKEEAHRSVRQLRHALNLEKRKVERLRALPDVKAIEPEGNRVSDCSTGDCEFEN